MKRKKIDKSQLKYGIPERIRNAKHLKWLSTLPCCRTNHPGPNDPAHISHELGKGTGCKTGDDNAVPLSHEQHMRQHSTGELSFWGPDIERAKRLAKDLYAMSGDTEKAVFRIFKFQRGE